MNCPNCGSNVNQGEAFCRVCGTKMPLPQQNNLSNNTQQPQQVANSNMGYQQPQQVGAQNINYQQSQTINNQTSGYQQQNVNPALQGFQQPQYNVINDDVLIDSYIGKNADKLKNGGFSANVFFFGFLYVLYRKMWLLGFIWLAVSIVANMFLASVASVITFAANIIISTQFKKFYLKHVEEQVDRIKSENPGKSQEQLMMLCSQKGGTTLIPVIVTIILYGLVLFFAFAVILGTIDEAKENAQNSQNDYNNTSSNVTTSSGTIGNLNVKIPSNLNASSASLDDLKMYHSSYDNDDSCGLTLTYRNASYYNNDAKKYLEDNVYLSPSDKYSGVSQKNINGNTWYYATVETSYSQTHYYTILNNGKIYEIEFRMSDDTNKTCSSAYNTIVNSLKFN